MSIQDTINNTINFVGHTINGTINLIGHTISATVRGIGYLFTHFPQVLKSAWEVFKFSLELGQLLATLAFKALKFVVENFPEIVKATFELAGELFKHLPQILKFVGYTVPKFFLFDLPKEIIKNLPAFANWLVTNIPHFIAHTVGIGVGIVVAPFKIASDLIFGKNNQQASRESQYRQDPAVDALLLAGVVGIGLLADGAAKKSTKHEGDGQQKRYTPSHDHHRSNRGGTSFDSQAPEYGVIKQKSSRPDAG